MKNIDLVYRIVFKNFFHFLNVSIFNSWILYKNQCNNIPLLQFKASIASTMHQIGKHDVSKRCKKSLNRTSTTPKQRKKENRNQKYNMMV